MDHEKRFAFFLGSPASHKSTLHHIFPAKSTVQCLDQRGHPEASGRFFQGNLKGKCLPIEELPSGKLTGHAVSRSL